MGKIISFFNHKGGVGKTTLVQNLGFILADKGHKILLIDADPQMNLTAAVYGLSTSVEYSDSADENGKKSKWAEYTEKYISLSEYLDHEIKDKPSAKNLFNLPSKRNSKGSLSLISGAINLADIEADLYGVIKNKNDFTKEIPHKFEQTITKQRHNYDFILIDTSPSASSIINALMIMLSDYFIAPVSPTFFSLQAIDNLSSIFQNWIKLLGDYQTTKGFKGLSFQPKFLGLVVQMAKRFNGGAVNATGFSEASERWISEVNISVQKFQKYAIARDMSVSEEEFRRIFSDSNPFIIQKCCDFTSQLRSIAEKAGIPVAHLTPEICKKYSGKTIVEITSEEGQYARSFRSIEASYNNIADGLVLLLG